MTDRSNPADWARPGLQATQETRLFPSLKTADGHVPWRPGFS